MPPPGVKMPGNSATVDHVKSREQVKSFTEYRAPSNMVLACSSCNARRNNQVQTAKSKKPHKKARMLETRERLTLAMELSRKWGASVPAK